MDAKARLAAVALLMLSTGTTLATPGSPSPQSARLVQGTFDSATDEQSFERALSKAFGGGVRLSAETAGDGDGSASDQFGYSIALSGETALVGAYLDDTPAGGNAGSAYVFTRIGTVWTQQAKLTAADGQTNDLFGWAVSLSGDTALVGAYGDDVAAVEVGSAYVFARIGTSWTQQAKLLASDGAAVDRFGYSVAVSGDTALVGAYLGSGLAVDGTTVSTAGKAYVYVRSGAAWTQQATLTAPDAATNDAFGFSVALSGDYALAGSYQDDTAAGANAGSAHVFVRSGSTWTAQTKLAATASAPGDQFGISVAISGNTALVGADRVDTPSVADAGSAYVYVRAGATWTQQSQLTASDGAAFDQLGISVALSGDDAVVGALLDDTAAGANSGSAYVFVRSATAWTQQAKLTAPDGAPEDFFGRSVALSAGTVLVGANSDDTSAGADAGSSHAYVRNGTSWSHQVRLDAGNGAAEDQFGISVALSGDTALVGAHFVDTQASADVGAAYVFVRAAGAWSRQSALTATDGAAGDLFGFSVAISGDTALVGALSDDLTQAGAGAGSAYVFVRNGTTWTQQAKLVASDGATSDSFGSAVALFGDTALVGAPSDDTPAGVDAGSAYAFLRGGTVWMQQAKLIASDGASGGDFGRSVALEGDTALAGAPGGVGAGSAYLYLRSGSTWTQLVPLTPLDGGANDRFGISVALSGNSALVGANADDTIAGVDAGSVYVFNGSGAVWTRQAQLVASDAAAEDLFGTSVTLSGDTALVGANWHDTPAGMNAGAAYVFSRIGTVWSQRTQLTAADGATEDHFGISVALFEDTALVGAFLDDSVYTDNANVGAAYVFVNPSAIFADGFEDLPLP